MCTNPKYAIGALLRQMPGKLMNNSYKICIELEISDTTLRTWMNYPKTGDWSIPSDKLFKLAEIFKCDPKALLN